MTQIPNPMSRLKEMLVGNDKTGNDLAGIAALPLFTAGAASIANTMTSSMQNISRGELFTFVPAQTPGMAEIAIARGAAADTGRKL